MAESDRFEIPTTPGGGGLIGAVQRFTFSLGQSLQAVQSFARGTVDALDEVARKAEETTSTLESVKSTQVGPMVGATSEAQPLKEITSGLMQQVGRR